MNNKLIAIGELLIDFTSSKTGEIKNIESFIKNPGGAPANVAVCCSKLGGNSLFSIKKLYLIIINLLNKVNY